MTYGVRSTNTRKDEAVLVLERFHQALSKCIGIETRFSQEIEQELWEKFVLITTLAGMTCLNRAAVGDVIRTDDGMKFTRELLEECLSAARFYNHYPRPFSIKEMEEGMFDRDSPLSASMLRDIESGQKTEAKHIILDMIKRSKESGNEARILSLVWMTLQARDNRVLREMNQRHKYQRSNI